MKLQKATRFALYALLELAADPERQISAAEIADKYGISINHLAKVLRDLSRAGLVESVRGVGGGYRFVGNAKRVTLLDVIALFEDISSSAEERGEPGARTDLAEVLHQVLTEIEDIARATLQSVTIDTMLKQTERRRRKEAAGELPEHTAAD
jgi:Rrf2 family protein